ncbi:MAG: PhoH family protein [Candidatus Lambdaproteobacteria bacterium]|nr:PhoH family protein [Candidatus Lambdaproteobacteria bacterium]
MAKPIQYILDTNVLLYDPNALLAFPEGEVIVPISVIEEIDQFKVEMSETGRNARQVSALIDRYRVEGNLSHGVPQANGSTIRVVVWNRDGEDFPKELDLRKSSNRVLLVALQQKTQAAAPIVLVSQDTNLRIKANALGIEAVSYEGRLPGASELYLGHDLIEVSEEEFGRYRTLKHLAPESTFYPNQGLIVQERGHPERFAVFRYHAGEQVLLPIRDFPGGVWEVAPRNPQQALALDLLMDPAVSLVTLVGKAGTGKTLLALAAGLQLMMDENAYTKLLVSRPIFPMGRDVGYLPGSLQEKLEPWMQPIFDNLEFLIASPISKNHPSKGYQALIDQGLINIEPLTYIRGRSIPHQFMIVDEAQNLTPHEIKTIITRVGVGTKIVLTGDPFQIDNPYVDSVSNGLSHVTEAFKSQLISGHTTLVRGERSPLAELAANIL